MKKLSEDRFLADLFTKDAVQANFLQRIVDAINNVAKGAGVAVSGDLPAPPPVNAITVKARGEMVHATLTHNAEVDRSINYFLEADTSTSFTQPHVMDLGSSRSHIFTLPTFNDAGGPQQWYLRAYAQRPGGKPSTPTVLGGIVNPTAIQLQGTTKMTILPSTGSGTASTTGQQGGSGRGKQRISTPKAVRIGKQQASAAAVVAPNVATHLATGSAPQIGSDASPFTFATTTTSITLTWSTFNLYRPDGSIQAMAPSPTGGIVISGLSPSTQYFIYPYYDEINQVIAFAAQGSGSPGYAYTAKSPTAAQTQNLTTHVPLAAGSISITTPATGTGGGTGGGGNCFTGETLVKTPQGWVPFEQLPSPAIIANETGRHVAELVIHENCHEPVIQLPEGGRVNLIHGIRAASGEYIRASDLFPYAPRQMFHGTLYNLHVCSEREEDHHFIVAPGVVAHNVLPDK